MQVKVKKREIEEVESEIIGTSYISIYDEVTGLRSDLEKEEVDDMFKRIGDRKVHFDLILSNPPFSIGNAITKAVIDNIEFDEYVNLMPVSKYAKGKLFNHIDTTEEIETFKLKDIGFDADGNGSIVKLRKDKANNLAKEDFEVLCYDKRFKDFYKENIKREDSLAKTSATQIDKTKEAILERLRNLKVSNNTSFCISKRACTDGVSVKEKAFNRKWNIEKSVDLEDLKITYEPKPNRFETGVGFLLFKTSKSKDNITTWWYGGDLAHLLIKGLNTQGAIWNSIPRINWETISNNRYWTTDPDLAVLDEMNLEFVDVNDKSKGVKRKGKKLILI